MPWSFDPYFTSGEFFHESCVERINQHSVKGVRETGKFIIGLGRNPNISGQSFDIVKLEVLKAVFLYGLVYRNDVLALPSHGEQFVGWRLPHLNQIISHHLLVVIQYEVGNLKQPGVDCIDACVDRMRHGFGYFDAFSLLACPCTYEFD